MVLCKTRMRSLLSCALFPLCVLPMGMVLAHSWASTASGSHELRPSASNERLRELMTQRYEILKVLVQNSERMLDAGRTDLLSHQDLTVALYRAQADLCTTGTERVKVYEKLVELLTSQERGLERQASAGQATGIQVDQAKLVMLSAQIDLERLRLGESAPQP